MEGKKLNHVQILVATLLSVVLSTGVFFHFLAQRAAVAQSPSPQTAAQQVQQGLQDSLGTIPGTSSQSGTTTGGSTRAFSNICVTKVGTPGGDEKPIGCTPSSSGGPSGPCMQAPPPPADIRGAISAKWGMTLNLPQDQLQYAWEEFHEIDCVGFLQDLRGTVINSWENNFSQQFSCPQDPGVDIQFGNHHGGDWVKALLVHELTHVWQFCSPRGEANLLQVESAYIGEDGLTKYSRRECPNFAPGLNRIYHEDQADTIALFLNPETGELTCGNGAPNPFSVGKPLHKSAAEKGVPKGVGPQDVIQ
jgi:hypothetical protein